MSVRATLASPILHCVRYHASVNDATSALKQFRPSFAAAFRKIRGMTLAAAGTSIHMRSSIPKAVERKEMAVAGALLIRRRGAAAAAAVGATRDAQHELGGARVGLARRQASEIVLRLLTRQAATGRRTPCPRAGSSWLASVTSRDVVYERGREWRERRRGWKTFRTLEYVSGT
jgi:hypothetical protein